VDSAFYEDIAGRLRGLLIRMSDRLTTKDQVLIVEFIDANEPGVALEQMAAGLSEDEKPLSADERSDMMALADRMNLGQRVSRALALCPSH